MPWTDSDEHAAQCYRQRMGDAGFSPWVEMRRWRRAFIVAAFLACVEAVVISVMLVGR